MKAIADLLAKKKSRRNYAREIDEKSIESVFFGLLEKKIPSIARVDILDFRLEEKKIYIKTAHPAIWRKREGLKKEINNFLESESVEEIKVK